MMRIMKKKHMTLLSLSFMLLSAKAQIKKYTMGNAHSHNDYEQARPFFTAYEAGFGSMEADVYLIGDQLLVAHSEAEQNPARTLEKMYLYPLRDSVRQNQGFPYKGSHRKLQLLIELKSENSVVELDTITARLKAIPEIAENHAVTVVFTGNVPGEADMAKMPGFIHFDGVPYKTYDPAAAKKIVMFSDDLHRYTSWDGTGEISGKDYKALKALVDRFHKQGKKFRFWNAPDSPEAWALFEKLGVDYINTDKIDELAAFLHK